MTYILLLHLIIGILVTTSLIDGKFWSSKPVEGNKTQLCQNCILKKAKMKSIFSNQAISAEFTSKRLHEKFNFAIHKNLFFFALQ